MSDERLADLQEIATAHRDLVNRWRDIAAAWRQVQAKQDAVDAQRAEDEQAPAVTSDRSSVTSGHEPSTTPETVAEPPPVSDDGLGSHVTRHVATLLTASETARRLAVSESTLYRLRRRGELPATRVGRSIRYAEDDVAAYLAQHRD